MNVLTLMGREDLKEIVFHGAAEYLPSKTEPVFSDAAKDLAERAMEYTKEHPLYVVAIAAITNVASACAASMYGSCVCIYRQRTGAGISSQREKTGFVIIWQMLQLLKQNGAEPVMSGPEQSGM